MNKYSKFCETLLQLVLEAMFTYRFSEGEITLNVYTYVTGKIHPQVK